MTHIVFRCSCRLRSLTERRTNPDGRAVLQPRFNGELSLDQLHPFPHAAKTNPAAFHGLIWVKASTRVAHRQLDHIQITAYAHREMACSAVLDSILESFLHDAEEAKRDFRRQILGDAFRVKINPHFLLL